MFDEEVLERVTGPDPVWSVIWLHGLGADNTDFQDLPKLLALPADVVDGHKLTLRNIWALL